ncbi:response regulator [Desulfobacterota bacterium M19]
MSFPDLTTNYQRTFFSFITALCFLLLLQSQLWAKQLVKVGIYENPPKIFTTARGKVAGFWPELIEYIAKQENWKIKYIPGSWNENLRRLKNNKIDIMPDVAYTEKRDKLFSFSNSSVLMSWSRLYVRKEAPSILSFKDLAGKKIAALKGSSNLEDKNGFREISTRLNLHCTFVLFNNYREVFKAVAEKRVDAGITNRNFGNRNAKHFSLKKTPIIFNPTDIKFAFPKNSALTPYLKSKIDRQMEILQNNNNSIYYQLLQKYFETGIAEKKVDILPQWFSTVLELIAGFGIILLLTIIVSRRQIRRKTAELSSQKALLESITENVPGVVYQFYAKNNGESGVRYTSSKLYDIFELEFIDDPPLLLKTFVENIHEKDRQSFIDTVKEASLKRTPWNWQGRYIKPDGETIWFEGISSPVLHKDEIAFNGLLLDITRVKKLGEEYKRAEKQLQRSQKMEAIGLMAGGVAHDLNNILSSIVSYPELILLDLPQDSPLRPSLEAILSAGLSAAAVVADMLTVARGSAAVKKICNLNKLLREYLKSPDLQHPLSAKPQITLKTNLFPDLLSIKCSTTHINKCILNLFINACEALEDTGTITVSTTNRYIDIPLKGYDDVRKGEYVVLSVADTGPGISSADIDHIFEPFYSKKVMGRSGTGLGLAVVWSAVQDHKGYIDILTGDHGTCFDLYFPASRELPDDENEEMATKDLLGNGQKILIIDDEDIQRDIAAIMLKRLVYNPVSVASGAEAVSFLEKNKVDLLLLDMIMPDMNGRETYERIIALHPGQKAVIATGFSETDEVRKAQNMGAGILIKKPYTLNQLGKAVKLELQQQA